MWSVREKLSPDTEMTPSAVMWCFYLQHLITRKFKLPSDSGWVRGGGVWQFKLVLTRRSSSILLCRVTETLRFQVSESFLSQLHHPAGGSTDQLELGLQGLPGASRDFQGLPGASRGRQEHWPIKHFLVFSHSLWAFHTLQITSDNTFIFRSTSIWSNVLKTD